MGLLDRLWDETVAGPRPDSGIGKLRRKYASFSPSSSSSAPAASDAPPSPAAAVTRSIAVARPPALVVDLSPRGPSSVPDSPATTPGSPFASATTPKGKGWRKLRRKPEATTTTVGPRSPTVYDWVVISSLDR